MKLLMIGVLALYGFGAFANMNAQKHEEMKKEWDKLPFEQQKEMKIKMLDKKSAMIDKSKSCVNMAKDKADLKECSEEMREAKQSMMEHYHGKTKQSQEMNKKDSGM